MKFIVACLVALWWQVHNAVAAPLKGQRAVHLDAGVDGLAHANAVSLISDVDDVHDDSEGFDEEGKPKMKMGKARRKKKEMAKFPEKEWTSPFSCNTPMVVNSGSNKDDKCPMECPFMAQDKMDDKHCSFQCVKAEDCAKLNPLTTIADPNVQDRGFSVCRKPMVQFCKEYSFDGTDTCLKCNSSHYLHKGQCFYRLMPVVWGVVVLLVLVFGAVGYWVFDIRSRTPHNLHGLEEALAFRSRQKLHTQKNAEGHRTLFPLSTNMLRTDVAGPGLMLHFNFQFMVIVWAFLVGFLWVGMGVFIDGDLFVLGTRRFGTPRENCILVAWGYETQQELMWTKIFFLKCVYIGTFICTLLHSIRQLRIFQLMDEQTKTMKDFVAMVEDLPEIPGSEKVEYDLKKAIEDATGQKVQGVSVAWQYYQQVEDIDDLNTYDITKDEAPKGDDTARALEDHEEEMPRIRKKLYGVEKWALDSAPFDKELAKPAVVKKKLEELHTSSNAFVVFETEKMRDNAVEKLEDTGMDFKGTKITLHTIYSEPDTIYWHNFGYSQRDQIFNLLGGFGKIFLALCIWTIVFYLPYAYSIIGFNYDNGQQPGIEYSMAFTMVVVAGNAMMYEACAQVSDGIGLRFKDDREAWYMILYTVACLFNVTLDFFTTWFMALSIGEELGFRTYHGVKLREIDSFTAQFESYAMQRILADNAYSYAWPSTFLVPFLLEPFITIIFPLIIMEWVVRSHPELTIHAGEQLMQAFPMELGRYADILLNILLGIIFFYFPGGATHKLFIFMAISHIWIYYFDHYKVLRAIPRCNFASMDVDWYSQAMCAPCTALVLSVLVFKANCKGHGYCMKGMPLVATCSLAFIAHTIVHLLLLRFVVPLFGKRSPEDHMENKTYAEISTEIAVSWFNVNPINCLRSKYFYEDKPYCRYCFAGKEHLLFENPEINCYFKDEAAEVEEFGVHAKRGWGTLKTAMQAKGKLRELAEQAKKEQAEQP